jgi:hypothetical protein
VKRFLILAALLLGAAPPSFAQEIDMATQVKGRLPQSYSYVSGGGSANAQTVALSPCPTAYAAGLPFSWLPTAANTSTTPTVNVCSLGAKTIVAKGGAPLAAGDLSTTAIAFVIYDGTNMELQNPQTFPIRGFAISFGDSAASSALSSGSVVYYTIPYACTIVGWDVTVDAGTATFDIWKLATGTAIPTSSNSITASALPAISTGTAVHSTTLTGWTTSVAADDIFGIQLNMVSTAKYAELGVQCAGK